MSREAAMIDLADDMIVHRVDTGDGRFLLFHRVDLKPFAKLPFSGIVLDTGGDGLGIALSLDPDPSGEAWSALDLLTIALARAEAEQHRRLGPLVADVADHLVRAVACERQRQDGQASAAIDFVPGILPSPYPWADAWRGPHVLPFCPDPESRQEGITPEQVLMAIRQIFADATVPPGQQRLRVRIVDHLGHALDGERRRVARVREIALAP
jgi:hypothetical protein